MDLRTKAMQEDLQAQIVAQVRVELRRARSHKGRELVEEDESNEESD